MELNGAHNYISLSFAVFIQAMILMVAVVMAHYIYITFSRLAYIEALS